MNEKAIDKKLCFIKISLFLLIFFPKISSGQNLIINPGCEEPLVGGEIPSWTEVIGTNWTIRTNSPAPQEGANYFFPGAGPTAELRQDVDVSLYASEIDNNNRAFTFTGYVRDFMNFDDSKIIIEYRDVTNSTVLTSYNTENISVNNTWVVVSDTRNAPIGTRFIRIRLISTRLEGTNNDGYYDNLSLVPTTPLSNLIQNAGGEAPLVDGKLPHWVETVGPAWSTKSAEPSAQEGANYFFAGESPYSEIIQDIDVSNYAGDIDNNSQFFSFNGYVRDWFAELDESRIILEYRDATNTSILSNYDSGNLANSSSWLLVSDSRIAPSGTRFIRVRLVSTRNNGNNNDGYYDNLSLEALVLLPVELISFTGRMTNNIVKLHWETNIEVDNKGFEIQKSKNGREWEVIDVVNGMGTTNEISKYEYKDANPFLGDNYYRLKQVDYDDSSEYSKVIFIDYNPSKNNIQVFPNPSDGFINIQIDNPSNQNIYLRITDNQGKKLWQSEWLKGDANWSKEMNLEKSGIYFITAQIGDEVFSERVVVE